MKLDLEKVLDEEIESKDDTPFTFGKHQGDTPNYVAQHDPKYLIWFYENREGWEEFFSEELILSIRDQ